MQIIFIVPSISDSHYRNRIIEFIDKGYTVNVYGFKRKNSNKKPVGICPKLNNAVSYIFDFAREKLDFNKTSKFFNT